eukprot:3663766-Karenia_brevis.AAC.1
MRNNARKDFNKTLRMHLTLSNPTWSPPKRLHAAMCNRPQFWEAFKLDPPLFPNCRVIAGLLRFGPEI